MGLICTSFISSKILHFSVQLSFLLLGKRSFTVRSTRVENIIFVIFSIKSGQIKLSYFFFFFNLKPSPSHSLSTQIAVRVYKHSEYYLKLMEIDKNEHNHYDINDGTNCKAECSSRLPDDIDSVDKSVQDTSQSIDAEEH